jgi:serralysin
MCGLYNSVGAVTSTGDARIDGLISGIAWDGPITYAFPINTSSYRYGGETETEFYRANNAQKTAVSFSLDREFGSAANDGFSVEGFTNASISLGAESDATIRAAQSALPPTSWAYLPGGDEQAGDVWLGVYSNVSTPKAGNYAWHTILHEMGHALGLKHGHDALNGFEALPSEYDTLEQSIMTYRSHPGASTAHYTYDTWGAPQTFMIADIAALQRIYGASFDTNNGDTVYSWRQGNGDTFVNGEQAIDAGGSQIFATIWDGGGEDTYNLSRFRSRLSIDLEPGEASIFNREQLSNLGPDYNASGNIYNALQYEGDRRSLIENAIGGRNRDSITGNAADNALSGRQGHDQLYGRDGNDTLTGGLGRDYLSGEAGDDILLGGRDADRLSGGAGNDTLTGGSGNDLFIFRGDIGADTITDFRNGADRIVIETEAAPDLAAIIAGAQQIGDDVLITLGESETVTLRNFRVADLDISDFLI